MVINGVDSESRELVFTWGADYQADKRFGRKISGTKIVQAFLDKFDFDANLERILTAVRTLYDEREPTTESIFTEALEVVMRRPGLLVKKAAVEPAEPEPAEAQAPEPPVHRGQQMWREHAEFMEHGVKDVGMPSGDEVRRHARESKSFRAFLQQGYEARMSGEIGGSGTILNAPIASSDSKPSEELLRWVEWYRRAPMEEVRRKLRADCNPLEYEHENKMFSQACRLGLV